jgi:Raf kinase inhibitor-like YbhB/YbcL family protein
MREVNRKRRESGAGCWVWGAAAAAALVGCGSSGKPSTTVPLPSIRLTVASPAFSDRGTIPARLSCNGGGARPTLRWSRVPSRAVELAVLVDDPDAPGGAFVHWTVWGLAPSTHTLSSASLPAGAHEGSNSAGTKGWTPPCPPKGDPPHRYVFGVYALSRHLALPAGAKPKEVEPAVRAAAIAAGSLTARYGR